MEDSDLAESVTALLFSPEEIIREEAAYLIARSNPELYISASERIPDLIKNRLDKIINGEIEKREMLFEKVQFLSSLFGGILEDELLSLASDMELINNSATYPEDLSEGFIIWTIAEDNKSKKGYVYYDISGAGRDASTNQWKKLPCYYLRLAAVEQYCFQFPDNSIEILKYIDDNES
jgi:hypothetical protein